MNKTKKAWYLCVAFIILLYGAVPQNLFAFDDLVNKSTQESRWILVKGEWIYISERSLPLIPVASISEDILLIENLAVNREITISIINSCSQKVYEDVIVKLSSSYVVISLGGFPEGDYTLELRNSSGGYLCGGFSIY